MHCIAIMNRKGGCGKTTTAVNLAAILGEMGKRVLLVDLDDQRNTTAWCLGIDHPEPDKDIIDYLMSGTSPLDIVVPAKNMPGVDVLPASTDLVNAEARMTKPAAELLLKKNMQSWPNNWDYVIMDTPGNVKSLGASAVIAASHIVIMTKPGSMDLTGLMSLMTMINEAKELINPDLKIAGILLSQAVQRTIPTANAIEMVQEAYPGLLFNTVIRQSVRFYECHIACQPITTYAPQCTGPEDYRSFTKELLSRVEAS